VEGRPGEEWWPQYKKEFELQLQSETKLNSLREIWSLVNSGKIIALLCYCVENTYCHRSIVAEFLKRYDVKVEEFVKEIPEKRRSCYTVASILIGGC
jgi:GTPase SAR1 family protein